MSNVKRPRRRRQPQLDDLIEPRPNMTERARRKAALLPALLTRVFLKANASQPSKEDD